MKGPQQAEQSRLTHLKAMCVNRRGESESPISLYNPAFFARRGSIEFKVPGCVHVASADAGKYRLTPG